MQPPFNFMQKDEDQWDCQVTNPALVKLWKLTFICFEKNGKYIYNCHSWKYSIQQKYKSVMNHYFTFGICDLHVLLMSNKCSIFITSINIIFKQHCSEKHMGTKRQFQMHMNTDNKICYPII